MNRDLHELREDYNWTTLEEKDIGFDPMYLFNKWFKEARNQGISEPNAFVLSTCSMSGSPRSRVVLLKEINEVGFIFYTNYHGDKAREIADNPNVSMCFLWKEMHRQIRIEGVACKTDRATSESYFNSRPRGSQIGAWSSKQSSIIPSRKVLDACKAHLESHFEDNPIPTPRHWGGIEISPQSFEFWQGRTSRLHDRICYEKNIEDNAWKRYRKSP